NDGGGHEQLRFCARIILGSRRTLSRRHVLGRLDELAKLFVAHRVPIHPEALDCHFVRRRFFRIVFVGSHEKSTTGDPDHVWERWVSRRFPPSRLLALLRTSTHKLTLSFCYGRRQLRGGANSSTWFNRFMASAIRRVW